MALNETESSKTATCKQADRKLHSILKVKDLLKRPYWRRDRIRFFD